MATNRAALTAEDYFAMPADDGDELFELLDGELLVADAAPTRVASERADS